MGDPCMVITIKINFWWVLITLLIGYAIKVTN